MKFVAAFLVLVIGCGTILLNDGRPATSHSYWGSFLIGACSVLYMCLIGYIAGDRDFYKKSYEALSKKYQPNHSGLQIVQEGTRPRPAEWQGKYICTGGKVDGQGCGALIFVPNDDSLNIYDGQKAFFTCPQCGRFNVITKKDFIFGFSLIE